LNDPQSAAAKPGAADRQISLPELRLSMRASNQFLLDAVVFASAGRDFTDNLILLAIVQANLALVTADPQLQLKYAAADSPPPDSMRRPISINAVAASLRLPFETVRRRVVHLSDQGICEITPRGVVVPERQVVSPGHLAILETNYHAVRKLYLRLRTGGCLPEPAVSRPPPQALPLRAVARLSSDFVLRLLDPVIATVGSLSGGFTLLAIFDLNTRGLNDDERGDMTPGAAGFVPDSLRRPATVRAVAERIGLPYEQTRRRLAAFVEEGRCSRAADGYVLSAENLARADMIETYRSCHLALQRMFAALGELGVLREWEAELRDGA
jgi:DNA-binding Lrp family transcriptional regulator